MSRQCTRRPRSRRRSESWTACSARSPRPRGAAIGSLPAARSANTTYCGRDRLLEGGAPGGSVEFGGIGGRRNPARLPHPGGPGQTLEKARLDLLDVRRVQPLRAPGHLELDPVTLGQAAEAARLNGRVVDEHILPVLLGDEPVALRVVEPLH